MILQLEESTQNLQVKLSQQDQLLTHKVSESESLQIKYLETCDARDKFSE